MKSIKTASKYFIAVTVDPSLSISGLGSTFLDTWMIWYEDERDAAELSRRMLNLGAEYGGNLDQLYSTHTNIYHYAAHAAQIPELIEGT